MVGGATPAEDGREIVLSLSRLNRMRDIDPVDMTMTIEAGVTLKAAQMRRPMPGACCRCRSPRRAAAQIGGVLATNAGGNNTVRYGNARDLVLGLEVVLPDGQVWNGLRRLRKDNTGYCLRQLFVGSEGTLGIITAAVLKLLPQPRETAVALCAVGSPEAALDLFSRFQRTTRRRSRPSNTCRARASSSCCSTSPARRCRLRSAAPALRAGRAGHAAPGRRSARRRWKRCWSAAMEAGIVADAAIAESEAQRAAIWRLREEHSEAQKRDGRQREERRLGAGLESARVDPPRDRGVRGADPRHPRVPFGHIGDGNIHFNLVQPEGADPAWFLAQDHAIMDAVNEVVRDLDGSFSAEHGIGRLKPYMMPDWRGGAELDLMRRIKAALDPLGIMNPGKVLP